MEVALHRSALLVASPLLRSDRTAQHKSHQMIYPGAHVRSYYAGSFPVCIMFRDSVSLRWVAMRSRGWGLEFGSASWGFGHRVQALVGGSRLFKAGPQRLSILII